jgi:uncharacterized protein with GYD domain
VQQITLPLAGKKAHLLHKFVSEIRAMVENVGTAFFINIGEYDLVIWIVQVRGCAVSVAILNLMSQYGGFVARGI